MNLDGWEIVLQPHVGKQRLYDDMGEVIGDVDVSLNQYRIFFQTPSRVESDLPPVQFGYVGYAPRRPINAICTLPDEVCHALAGMINAKLVELGRAGDRKLFLPAGFVEPPSVEPADRGEGIREVAAALSRVNEVLDAVEASMGESPPNEAAA